MTQLGCTVIKCNCILSAGLIREREGLHTGTRAKKRVCCNFYNCKMATKTRGFGPKSCAANKQECVFDLFEF